jgi:hypothetical protein
VAVCCSSDSVTWAWAVVGEPLRVADREPVRDVTGFRALRFSFWGESSFQTSA